MDGGAGGTCDNSEGLGGYQCCAQMDCLNSQCVYDVEYTSLEYTPASNSLSGAKDPGAFNWIQESFVVPSAPSNASHVGNLVLWFGAQNSFGTLVQPELWFNLNPNQWTMYAQFTDTGTGGNYPSGHSYEVVAGETLTGEAWIWQGNVSGDGYYWSVVITDSLYNNVSAVSMGVSPNDAGTGGGHPYVTQAWGGVMEVHGLSACDGLPADGYQIFDLEHLTQMAPGSSGWETDIDATAAVWSTWNGTTTQPPGPSCAYGGEEFLESGSYYTELYWNTTP